MIQTPIAPVNRRNPQRWTKLEKVNGISGSAILTDFKTRPKEKSEPQLFSFVRWDTDATHCDLDRTLAPFHAQLDPSILLERLTLLQALDLSGSIDSPSQTHLQKIQDVVTSRRQGRFGIISDISPFVALDPAARKTVLQALKTEIKGTNLASLAHLVEQSVISGTPFPGSKAERIRTTNQCHPLVRNNGILADTVKLLAHRNPRLRILELGNGADETTRLVLAILKSHYGQNMYSTYIYAATSLPALERAKRTFEDDSNIHVVSLNVEERLEGQDLQAGTYDLIISSDFWFPIGNTKACANYLKHLIHPHGHLILLDDTLIAPEWASLVKNLLSDWTPKTSSVVKDEGLARQVQNVLLESGFTFGTGYSASSGESKIIAQLKKVSKDQKKITLIVPHHHHPLVNALQMSFQKSGIRCDRRTIEGDLPPGQDIMSIVDFDTPYLYNIAEDKFRNFANRLSNFKSSMIWVTPAAQISCKNPNSAMILGLTRTLRAELRKDITVVEIDDEATTYISSSKSLLKIYQGLGQRLKLKDIDPDYEYAIVNGDIKIPRLHWATGEEELAKCVSHFAKHGGDPQNPQATNGSQRAPTAFRSNASYLLVGGLGGLGRVVAAWMVDNGARNILFLSRSAKEGPETTPFFDELRDRGCTVSTFSGSVTSQSDVETAVKQLTVPLAGVMQMSAVMRDNWMSQMTFAEWNQCVQPKVQGTWNLHQATLSTQLDFFVLFSSICGMVGQWGQANYNSANSFLDAFVNYRHGQGLSASVVDIGFMGGVGMAMENDALVEKLKASGYLYLDEQDLLAALTVAIAHSRPGQDQFMKKSQLCLGLRSIKSIIDPSTRVAWKKDARMAFSHGLDSLV